GMRKGARSSGGSRRRTRGSSSAVSTLSFRPDTVLGDVLAKERLADLVAFLREAVEPGWPEPLRLAPSESGPRLLFAIDGEAAPELVERVKAALVYGFEDAGVGLNFEEAPPAVALAACDGESAIVTAEMLEALAAWLPPTYQPED